MTEHMNPLEAERAQNELLEDYHWAVVACEGKGCTWPFRTPKEWDLAGRPSGLSPVAIYRKNLGLSQVRESVTSNARERLLRARAAGSSTRRFVCSRAIVRGAMPSAAYSSKLLPEEVAHILRLHRLGMVASDIASRIGRSKTSVTTVIAAARKAARKAALTAPGDAEKSTSP